MKKTIDELANEERRAYYRAYYAKHKEEKKQSFSDYWKRRVQKKLLQKEQELINEPGQDDGILK